MDPIQAFVGRGAGRQCQRGGARRPGRTADGVLANGIMARCLELDGTHETGGGHAGVCIVPAALALAESGGEPVSGRTLILGAAPGVDMLCRLRMGAGKSRRSAGWPRRWPRCAWPRGGRGVKGDPRNPFTLEDCVERFLT